MCVRGFVLLRGRPRVRKGPLCYFPVTGWRSWLCSGSWAGRFLHWTQTPPGPPDWAFLAAGWASWGGREFPAVSRALSCHPSCPPAVCPLNHELFCEIPCPVHNRDRAVSSAPSLALWNSWVILLRKNKSAWDRSHAWSFSLCQAAGRQSYSQASQTQSFGVSSTQLPEIMPPAQKHSAYLGFLGGICLFLCFCQHFLQQYPE